MLNRLMKIICRDNQYGGFLKVRGEYSDISESGDDCTSSEDEEAYRRVKKTQDENSLDKLNVKIAK